MLRETNQEEAKKFIALTYGTVTLIDHNIGQVISALDRLGYSENTAVIYTSDHGDLMGEHGLLFKGPSPFNAVFQVPLIMRVPRITTPSITDSLASSIDLPISMMSLLKIRERYRPPDMQGHDLTPILKDSEKEVRDCCLIENDEEVGPKGPLHVRLRHLITKDYKLSLYEGLMGHADLYNRNNDPWEMNNLWYDEAFTNTKCKLINRLLHEIMTTQSRFPKRLAGT